MGFFDRVKAVGDRFGAAWNGLLGREGTSPPPAPEPPPPPPVDPGLPDRGLPHVSGFPGGRIISTANANEVLRQVEQASSEGRRVSLNVFDKSGIHQLYRNPAGAGRHVPDPGMTASELQKRLERDGVPGERERAAREQWQKEHGADSLPPVEQKRIDDALAREEAKNAPPPEPEPVAPPEPEPVIAPEEPRSGGVFGRIGGFFGGLRDRVAGVFGRGPEQTPAPGVIGESTEVVSSDGAADGRDEESGDTGEEEEDDDFPEDDFPEDWDNTVGESDAADGDSETEGYDAYSVSGYQVVIYY